MPKYYSPDGNIEVWKQKPNGYYTIEEWQELHPAPLPPEPSIDEQLAELDAQYNAEIIRLGNEYNTAQLRGDTDIQSALKEEMASLDAWYDEEYQKIEGSEDNG